MNCYNTVDVSSAKALQIIKEEFGTDTKGFYDYFVRVVDDVHALGGFTPSKEFKEWYKNKYGEEPDFNKGTGAQIANRIKQFIYKDSINAIHTSKVNKSDAITSLGYLDAASRSFGQRLFANTILDFYAQTRYQLAEKQPINKRAYYTDAVASRFQTLIVDRISEKTGMSIDDIYDKLDESDNPFVYLEEALGGNKMTIQDRNLLAVVKEVYGPNADKYFEEVFRDSRLSIIRLDKDSSDDGTAESLNKYTSEDPANEEGRPVDQEVDASLDSSYHTFEHRLGDINDFRGHIDEELKTYFGSIRRLRSTSGTGEDLDYDTSNSFGLVDVMDADEVSGLLYTRAQANSKEEMIDRIATIADTVPGAAGLKILADEMKVNDELANQVFNTFSKTVITKIETIVDEKGSRAVINNQRADNHSSLVFEFMNDVRSNAITMDADYSDAQVTKLSQLAQLAKKDIDDNFDTSKDATKVVRDLTVLVKSYYPSVSEEVIKKYIKAGVPSEQIKNLVQVLKETVKASRLTQEIKSSRDRDIIQANKHNWALNQRRADGDDTVRPQDYINVAPLYNQSYLHDSQNKAAIHLADVLNDFMPAKISLNGKNAEGHNSSHVINNSMITDILKTLKDDVALEDFGRQRFSAIRSKLSNVLLERRENGRIVNYGLFREENGVRVPTEYAHNLIKSTLYDGAGDLENGSNAVYSKMVTGDYIASAFINFFRTPTDVTQERFGISFGSYFMRTPSDAPKNFAIIAPKYAYDDKVAGKLFKIENEAAVNKLISDRFASIEKRGFSLEDMTSGRRGEVVNPLNPISITLNQAARIISGESFDELSISKRDSKGLQNDQRVKMMLKYNSEDNISDTDNIIVFATYSNGKLKNLEFDGVYNNVFSTTLRNRLHDKFFRDIERAGNVSYVVNENHPIYKQFYNVFKQEMTDMAVAVNKFFKTYGKDDWSEYGKGATYDQNLDGAIALPNGELRVRDGVDLNNPLSHGGYEVYHTDKQGRVLVDGKLVGNVFKGNGFTLIDRKTGEVKRYDQEVIDSQFDILYGGAQNKHLHFTKDATGKVEEVRFTPEQEAAIKDMLTRYITDFVSDGYDRISNYKQFIKGVDASRENVAEFLLNTSLMSYAFDELYEGDSKFYGSAQDFLKRAKEAQAGGTPYATADFRVAFDAPASEINSSLDHMDFKSVSASGVETKFDVRQKTKFKAVTITNTVRTDEADINRLIGYMVKAGTKREVAEQIIRKAHEGVKTNDAQSYITFEEFIRRIHARGQLMKYKPLIDAILDESKPIDANIIGEFVQVQKNFYYDQYFDPEFGIMVPRQIKNAEFVLIPRLIKGTELETVYNLMKEAGIDQLNTRETSKAGKKNILSLWDNEGNLTEENISSFRAYAKGVAEDYNYRYLYTQQETPQHTNTDNKISVQIVKKIIDNIKAGTKAAGYKDNFFKHYNEKINRSFNKLMDELKVPRDENGNLMLDEKGNIVGLDYEKISARLQEEAMRTGVDSNQLDYFTLKDDAINTSENANSDFRGFDTIMPMFMSNMSTKTQSVVNALFNSVITRQKLNGFHAAQITNVGFKPNANTKYTLIENSKTLPKEITKAEYDKLTPAKQKKYKSNAVSYAKNLKYHPDGKPYVEIMLNKAAFGFDTSHERFAGLSPEEINAKCLKELQDAGLDDVIGYRIPTEGKQSMCLMKVVGFIDDAYGSTIVVPDSWVAQTGSDFDIDSVYGIQHKHRFNKKTGVIEKIHYNSDDVATNYKNYVLSNLTKEERNEIYSLARVTKEDINAIRDEIREEDGLILSDELEQRIQDEKAENLDFYLTDRAKRKGLLNKEEFEADKDNLSYLTNDEVDNAMVDDMMDILKDPSSTEENLSASTFVDITDAQELIESGSPLAGMRKNRSPYNFLDQADYMNDVMSGARLKAFSVTRDTFCSVCNTVMPTLNKLYTIKINYGEGKGIIEHKEYGWSKNNRNVDGRLITPYSSETSAHAFDAVKNGSVPNVNDFTFAAYKLFPEIGSNYKTAVSFIMQDGIRRIVDAYNANKSIYSGENKNPVHTAIKSIANDLGIKYLKSESGENIPIMDAPIDSVIDALNRRHGARYKNITRQTNGISLELKDAADLVFDTEVQIRRARFSTPLEEMSEDARERTLLYDLSTILQFNRLNFIANKITDIARVCNPDKFGAKQSIYATNKVFDDINEILSDEHPVLEVNGKAFLKAMYPGVEYGLDEYIKNATTGAYPFMSAFLHRASASSIKIARSMFDTQSSEFRRFVNDLGRAFDITNKVSMDERTYTDYERYILGHFYQGLNAVSKPITSRLSKQGTHQKFIIDDAEGHRTPEEELARIYGYSARPDLKVERDGELVEFTVKDINAPTETELREFNNFSPAQKIEWIKRHSTDAGIFKYLEVSLSNDYNTRRNKAGQQTIEFSEDQVHIENIYKEFENTFNNDNPFLASAALDLIKYGFAVEGFKMGNKAINKVIKNSALYLNDDVAGVGIIDDLVDKVRNVGMLSDTDMNAIREQYLRSHMGTRQLASTYVRKVTKYKTITDSFGNEQKVAVKEYEISPQSNGLIVLDGSKAQLEKYKIEAFDNKGMPVDNNKYIKLRFGKDEILYRVVNDGYGMPGYLIPLNRLEENEHGVWSANPANNKYYKPEYYEAVIHNIESEYNNAERLEINPEDFKYKRQSKIKEDHLAKDFDLHAPKENEIGSFEFVHNTIEEMFVNINADTPTTKFIWSPKLSEYITHKGIEYGSTQTIYRKERDAAGAIMKDNKGDDKINGYYKVDVYKVNLSALAKKYLGNTKAIAKVDAKYADIITKLRENNKVEANDIFAVQLHRENVVVSDSSTGELRKATAVECDQRAYIAVENAAREGNEYAQDVSKSWREKGITKDRKSIEANIGQVTYGIYNYARDMSTKLMNDINYFAKSGDRYLSIKDPEVIAKIKTDVKFRRKYLDTILTAQTFVDQLELYKHLSYAGDDAGMKSWFDSIRESINVIENNPLIDEAFVTFGNDFLKGISTNPLVQDEILSVLDGYHSTSFFDAQIGDLQESANPMVQILTKNIMADIEAKVLAGKDIIKNYNTIRDNIREEARKAGFQVNYDNIIDENGKLIQPFTQKYIDDYYALNDRVNDAIAAHGENSVEHLKARLEERKWLANNVEQEALSDYYHRLNKVEEAILTSAPQVYARYNELISERSKLIDSRRDGYIDDVLEDKIKEVNKKIKGLSSEGYYDPVAGEYKVKPEYDEEYNPLSSDPARRKEQIINSLTSAQALKTYLDDIAEARHGVWTVVTKKGFNETLDKNLAIIKDFEATNTPQSILMMNPKYAAAKKWIHDNARLELSTEDNDYYLGYDFDGVKDLDHFDNWIASNYILKNTKGQRASNIREELRYAFEMLKGKGVARKLLKGIIDNHSRAVDEFGVVNAREFTDEEIAKLKAQQLTDNNIRGDGAFSDKTIISNGKQDRLVYKTSFYKGLTVNGASNPEYLKLVNEYNDIVRPYYNSRTKTLHTSEMPIEVLREVTRKLFDLEQTKTKKGVSKEDVEAVIKFRKENVDVDYNWDVFNNEKSKAQAKDSRYFREWMDANTELVDGEVMPNSRLYGVLKPKKEKLEKYTDVDRSRAHIIIDQVYDTTYTEHYYAKKREMENKANEAKDQSIYDNWYNANHIYNPYSHSYEPLMCWQTRTIKDNIETTYEPNSRNQNKVLNEEWKNPNHKDSKFIGVNYKKNAAHPEYANVITANPYELKLRDHIAQMMQDMAKTKAAQSYIQDGSLPARASAVGSTKIDEAKNAARELKKFIGIFGIKDNDRWDEEFNYDVEAPQMPMLSQLESKDTSHKRIIKPKREGMTEEEYAAAMNEYHKELAERKAHNDKIHSQLLDRDYDSVLQEFMERAIRYNAIQDNRQMLFYGKRMLERNDVMYARNRTTNKFKFDKNASTEDAPEYLKVQDTRLKEQYNNWLRRLYLDQWKEPTDKRLGRVMSFLQNLTSAQYMMLNIRGGIANVTVGEANILAEAFAREYFGVSQWAAGKSIWTAGMHDYFSNMFSEKADTLQGALIKFLNVVDYDEVTGTTRIADRSEWIARVRDLAFGPQTLGEHFMQNAAMFSMMLSHRLIRQDDGTYALKTETEYMRDADIRALKQVMTDEQKAKFDKIKEETKLDAQKLKAYAWFRSDFITDFAYYHLDSAQRDKFIETRKNIQKKAKDEFNNDETNPTLYSQFELGQNRELAFKKGSLMDQINKVREGQEVSDAYQILGAFKRKTISVNQKIHGKYGKLDSAQIEKHVFGSIVMQYHKHIYPGIMKRWRRQGYYNEERGTIEKGCYQSLIDFLSMPIRKAKMQSEEKRKQALENGMTEAETSTMEGIQNFFKATVNYLSNIKQCYGLLPEYERANIRRNLGDITGVMAALFGCIIIKSLMTSEDDKKSLMYNLALYECDRLATETWEFNPLGAWTQAKTLWSSPVSVQSGINDLFHTMGELSAMFIEGDDYDGYYHNGMYAGENKLAVYTMRRLPIIRQWWTMDNLAKNNKYYKIGDTLNSIVPINGIVDTIQGK